MNIKNIEVETKIKPYNSEKRPDIKAYVSLVFSGLVVVNGFSIRVSNRGGNMAIAGYWLAKPISQTRFMYFNVLDEDFWKELEKAVIEQFIDQQIPIVN